MSGKRVTEDERLEFKRLHGEGLALAEISAKTGRDAHTISDHLHEMGVPMRGRGHPRGVGSTPRLLRARHGMTGHAHYPTWMNMMQRCYVQSRGDYKNYGGRGIEVFGPWHDPRVYIEYVESVLGPRPGPDYTINRIDNNGNYWPGNIEWAPRDVQNKNRDLSRNA